WKDVTETYMIASDPSILKSYNLYRQSFEVPRTACEHVGGPIGFAGLPSPVIRTKKGPSLEAEPLVIPPDLPEARIELA
ncbi:MAG: hypothetical protein AAGU11_21085, partial [Syntrophobacteraceae bacterium]